MAVIREWVISINLGDIDGIEADEWMGYIERAVMLRDPEFDGLLSMTVDEHDDGNGAS